MMGNSRDQMMGSCRDQMMGSCRDQMMGNSRGQMMGNNKDQMMGNSKGQMMQKVYETGFALDELLLYLDTHPEDAQAMEYYRYAQKANREAVRAYENAYGPLMMNQVTSNNWSWVKSPWPWEGGAC